MALLEVRDLTISLQTSGGAIRIVHGVNFTMQQGEIVGLLGESGCGKSLTAMSILRLLPQTMKLTGKILLGSVDLLALSEAEMCAARGNEIGMIFQEPMTALNPSHTIGRQVAEPLRLHKGYTRRQAMRAAVDLLARVGISRPTERASDYPHQLSGGQRQRVGIAMAIACEPKLLIADEPTTALDTLVQRQVMDLLVALVEETRSGLLLITHDVGLMSETADRMEVMYGGTVVETGPAEAVLSSPAHPYTQMLLDALPQAVVDTGVPLRPIPGSVPPPHARPLGCSFRDRCREADPTCATPPLMVPVAPDHAAACVKLLEVTA